MTHFPDLAPCTYVCPSEEADGVLAVGWLEAEHPYNQGNVCKEVVERLRNFISAIPWQLFTCLGVHECTLCISSVGNQRHAGFLNLYIPGDRVIYVAPTLIVHYISEHHYLPPSQFCEAVMKSPPMHSEAYRAALVKNGSEIISRVYDEMEEVTQHMIKQYGKPSHRQAEVRWQG